MEAIRRPDAQARLIRALTADAALAGCTLSVSATTARPWASATYVGEQQALDLVAAPLAAARRWLAALPEAELAMRGHVAMPPTVERTAARDDDALDVRLSVLTLIDD